MRTVLNVFLLLVLTNSASVLAQCNKWRDTYSDY